MSVKLWEDLTMRLDLLQLFTLVQPNNKGGSAVYDMDVNKFLFQLVPQE